MGKIYLNEKVKKDLNRIRPNVKLVRVKGIRSVRFSDIVAFLVDYYKKREEKK